MITVNGAKFRTLEDEFFVDGRKVYEAWANGCHVYPDDDYGYEVHGNVRIDLRRMRAYETWVMPNWWNAELRIDVSFSVMSTLPIYRMKYLKYDIVLMGLEGFGGVRYKGWSRGKIELADFGRYIMGHFGATDASNWSRYQSTQSDPVEQESLGFGSEEVMVTGSTIGLDNAAHVDGRFYTPTALIVNNRSNDINHGNYEMMWPDERREGGGDGGFARLGWNGSDMYSTFNGGSGTEPGAILTQNVGTCEVSGSACPWSGVNDWARQWIDEYQELYG